MKYYELWIMKNYDYELWIIMNNELWIMNYELWIMNYWMIINYDVN